MKRRIFAAVLCLALALSLLPMGALAADTPIAEVELSGITTDLKADEKPVFTAELAGDSMTQTAIRNESWSDLYDTFILTSDVEGKWFPIAGHPYEYGIVLDALPGYTFDNNTVLKYDGKTYGKDDIGFEVYNGGASLGLWKFIDNVTVPADDFKNLTIDLTRGKANLTMSETSAFGYGIYAAWEAGQVDITHAESYIDLDKDGNTDLTQSYDKVTKTTTLEVESSTFSLKDDYPLTLIQEALDYEKDNGYSICTESITFRFRGEENPYTLDLSKGPVTLGETDLNALVSTLMSADVDGKQEENETAYQYSFDLDMDGTRDLQILTADGKSGEVSLLETASFGDSIEVPIMLKYAIQGAYYGESFYTKVNVIAKAAETPEAAKDLGSLTIDLSKDKAVTVTQAEYDAFRATLSGLPAVKAKTEGDVISYDLDGNGTYDLEVSSAYVFSLKEDCSLKANAVLTLNDAGITAINTAGTYKEYYKTVTVKIPATETSKVNPFEDVFESDPYYDAVLWAYYAEPQITTGTTATKFGPKTTVTRGQCVTFLWRAMGQPEPTTTKNPFTDVKATDYYYKAVLWAVEKGITNGTDATHFSPNRTLSTLHIVTFLYRTVNPGEFGWNDGKAETWARQYDPENLNRPFGVDIAVSNNTDCPRANVVQFLYVYTNHE